jgi:predicted nuclease with RNAse H fold
VAKDNFIKEYQTRERIVAMLRVFQEYGIDAVMGPLSTHLDDSIREAEQSTGKKIIRIYTPAFDLHPEAVPAERAEAVFDRCADLGATFCMPHQSVTDALLDRRAGVIRDLEQYTRMIRARCKGPSYLVEYG